MSLGLGFRAVPGCVRVFEVVDAVGAHHARGPHRRCDHREIRLQLPMESREVRANTETDLLGALRRAEAISAERLLSHDEYSSGGESKH